MDEQIERKAEFLKAIAQPTRLKILELLKDGERCVCEIFPAIGEQQPNVSRHLQMMRRAGVLTMRKEGLRAIYGLSDPRILDLLKGVDALGRSNGRRR